MAKPVLLTVDDDPDVLRAVERDLRRQYGERYRVLRADSGKSALDTLAKLQQRNEPVALLLVDHRMPQMNGIETLNEAIKLFSSSVIPTCLYLLIFTHGFPAHVHSPLYPWGIMMNFPSFVSL